MRYRLSLPEPDSHLFHVEAALSQPGEGPELCFPVWTPGSYLVREFARHVEGLRAEDGEGRPLALTRLDKHRVSVAAGGAGSVVLRYRVYANELTVRTCHLDGSHGYLNGAAVFPYAAGRLDEPCELEVVPPEGWQVSTALPGGPVNFTARDYDELADSPVEIGRHRLLRFEAGGRPHELAIWGRGHLDEAALIEDVRRIVEAFARLFGGLPYDRYLFILHLTDRRRGGLEHARSTTLDVARTGFFPRDAYEESLGLVAHEFFHLWNVKRLRPAAFVPYDYAREQYTRLLWWFEGVTSYYDGLGLVRAGIVEPRRYLRTLGQALTTLQRTPGAAKTSAEESSFLTWVKQYRPDENTVNSTVSYYLKGELVALALDLALRRAGGSLDALVRDLVARHAARGLPEDGVERVRGLLGRRDALRVRPWGSIQALPATVREVAAAADPSTRTFLVKADIGAAGLQLGQTSTVLIERPEPVGVATLPLAAVTEQHGKSAVWLVDPASMTVRLQPIAVAEANGNSVVVASGLSAGQTVVTAGVHALTPGQKVRYYDAAAARLPPGASATPAPPASR
jgi:predicted metalloprotease with PDZ domain